MGQRSPSGGRCRSFYGAVDWRRDPQLRYSLSLHVVTTTLAAKHVGGTLATCQNKSQQMTTTQALNLSAIFAAYACSMSGVSIVATVAICVSIATTAGFAGYTGIGSRRLFTKTD